MKYRPMSPGQSQVSMPMPFIIAIIDKIKIIKPEITDRLSFFRNAPMNNKTAKNTAPMTIRYLALLNCGVLNNRGLYSK